MTALSTHAPSFVPQVAARSGQAGRIQRSAMWSGLTTHSSERQDQAAAAAAAAAAPVCEALSQLAVGVVRRNSLVRHGAVPAALGVLQAYSEDPITCEASCRALSNLFLGSNGAGRDSTSPAIDALLTSPPSTTDVRTVSTASGPVLALATPIVEGTKQVGSFLAVYDLSSLRADQRHVLVLALIEAAVALIAAVLGTYLLLRRLLGTIGSMTSTARAIEEGDLDQRLGDPGTDDEVAELAATLDAMLDRIDEVMSVQRQLLSDVSHQLRTPLTVVRGHLEVMGRTSLDDPAEIREVIEMLVGEVDHMGQLTEQLLLLGRSLEPDFVTTTPTDLRSFIGDIGAAAMVLAEGRFTLGSIDDLVIDVDETKLRGAILNLIDNAVKAIGPADQVRLSAYRVDGTGPVLIHVEDSGPGISPEVRARVLERFGRLDTETRGGSGLGLAIVRAVAEAHGGTFELGTSALGGLDATIVLPDDVVFVDGRTKEERTT